jgi:hypothetical protein
MLKIDRKKMTKIISLVALLALALMAIFFLFFSHKNPVPNTQEDEQINWSEQSYSRLSFFNGQNIRVGMNIPESWEGNYRLVEEGDKADFYYLDDSGGTSLMFSVYKKNELAVGEEGICEKNGVHIVFEEQDFVFKGNISGQEGAIVNIKNSLRCY